MERKRKHHQIAQGGYKQVAAASKETRLETIAAEPVVKSMLATLLLHEVFWGAMSANLARKIAEAAFADGASHPDLQKLSELGASGSWAGNVYRDLLRTPPSPR